MRIESTSLNVGFVVSKQTVLDAYKLVLEEWRKLGETVSQNGPMLTIDLCGDDPVSHDAERFFNQKLSELRLQSSRYVDGLGDIARQLHDSAMQYGFTEDQISAHLSSISAGPQSGPAASAPNGQVSAGATSDFPWRPPGGGWGPR